MDVVYLEPSGLAWSPCALPHEESGIWHLVLAGLRNPPVAIGRK